MKILGYTYFINSNYYAGVEDVFDTQKEAINHLKNHLNDLEIEVHDTIGIVLLLSVEELAVDLKLTPISDEKE